MMNYKIILVVVTFLIFIVPVYARTTCTPSACPVVSYSGKQMSTNWESNIVYNSYNGSENPSSCSLGGDYCIRECRSNNACYGPVSVEFDDWYLISDYCDSGFGTFVSGTMYDLDKCYVVYSKAYFDSDDYDPDLRYEARHDIRVVNDKRYWYLYNTGTRAISSTKWAYVMPNSIFSNKPSGYDFYSTFGWGNVPIETYAFYEQPLDGCSHSFVDVEADMIIYSIPYYSNLVWNSSCLQNSPPSSDIRVLKYFPSPTVLLNASNVNTQVNILKSDSSYFQFQWVDDPEDDSFWNGEILVYYGVTSPDILLVDELLDERNYTITNCPYYLNNCTFLYNFMWNTDALPDGIYKIKVVVRDKWAREVSRTWNQVRFYSSIKPTVNLNSPSDNIVINAGSYINFNYTSTSAINTTLFNELIINGITYFSGYESNGTPHNHTYQFNTPGIYTWKVQATDANGVAVSETRNFTVVAISKPVISSHSVTNIANVGSFLQCNATVIEGTYPISNVNCSIFPAGVSTTMLPSGGIYTGTILAQNAWATDQNYNITACDTMSNCVYVTGTIKINHYPSFISQNVNPSSPIVYSPNSQVTFTSTWSDDIELSYCSFVLDGIAYSAVRMGNSCSYSVTGLSAGNHNYAWSVTDIGGLSNFTPNYPNSYTYIVNKATPVITHSISPSNSIPSGTAVSGSCSVANNTGSAMTYNRCILQASASQTTPGTLTFGPVTPGIGTYICNCSVASSNNWNYAESIITLSVTGSTPPTISDIQPSSGTVINSGTTVAFNVTVTPGSYPVSNVYAYLTDGITYMVNGASMSYVGNNKYTISVTFMENWGNNLYFAVGAKDTNNVWSFCSGVPYCNLVVNNHPPSYYNLSVSPVPPVQYSPTRIYTFNATWTDDLYSVVGVNVTIDGTSYVATSVGGNIWQYNITGLSYGQHNYSWTAVDSHGAVRTTPVQYYSVGVLTPIFTINILPSVSVIAGTQTNASCVADVNVTPQLWRDGSPVSNPDVETLPAGQYRYLCNFTPTGNYSYSYTTDLLIVNPPNIQVQTQFCDGNLEKMYTYDEGGENYTMCVNIPCGSNVTSATLNLTGLVLYKIKQYFVNMFRKDNSELIGNVVNGCVGYYSSVLIYNSYFDCLYGNAIVLNNVRFYNVTINLTMPGIVVNMTNVILTDTLIKNGRIIYGNISYNEDGQVQFDI